MISIEYADAIGNAADVPKSLIVRNDRRVKNLNAKVVRGFILYPVRQTIDANVKPDYHPEFAMTTIVQIAPSGVIG